ncbi:MAG: pyrroloquinoline quinone-dependent dehydrogenase [Bryobacteraceae bacterium]
MRLVCLMSVVLLPTAAPMPAAESPQSTGWSHYGGDAGGAHYSSLKQIDRRSVSRLKLAWEYHSGDLAAGGRTVSKAAFETTPILVGTTLYFTTAHNKAVALDAATGKEKWTFDPALDRNKGYSEVTSRGVSYWKDPKGGGRLFYGTIDARLIALDAQTGKLCPDFGKGGIVDLGESIGGIKHPGDYQVTSPPAIVGDVLVVGSSIGDNGSAVMDRGTVRGFDVHSGRVLWSWDPIPALKDSGAANAWSVISADVERGLVFIPTGSASPDFFGGMRKGDDKWANSVVALKAKTGEFVWGYQVVRHDLWDYDVAAEPVLVTWKGKPAVAVTTKMGFVFVLDRLTGKPLLGVEERRVPTSTVPGEEASATQPIPLNEPLVPQSLKPEDAFGATPEIQKWCADKIRSLHWEGMYTPIALKPTLAVPGNAGGSAWGGPAYDPARGLLIANTNNVPFAIELIPRDDFAKRRLAGDNRLGGEFAPQRGTPYGMYRVPLRHPSGSLCGATPWGALAAVDIATGKKKWQVPLGTMIAGQMTGTPNMGGPIVTAGGLIFIGAAMDDKLRAFDVETGKELWHADLPAGGQATPMTFSVNGRQFVLIAAGGHGKLGTKQGDSVVAYALPE